MNGQTTLEYLKSLYTGGQKNRGSSLKRALLCVAIPAAAGLATACYGVPMDPEPAEQVCNDAVDNDDDGAIDCDDSDCAPLELCLATDACDDGVDNDSDTFIDCDDPDCAGVGVCP